MIAKFYSDSLVTENLTLLHLLESLKNLGFQEATKAGISIGIDDLIIPISKKILFQETESDLQSSNSEFLQQQLSPLEKFQKFIDSWQRTSELIKQDVVKNFEATDMLNPVYMMAFSGARGNIGQVSQLVGMRGFMADPEGKVINYPIRSNFREGLTLPEYMISCYGARKGTIDTALKTADAGYLTRRLVDVAHHVIISKKDCKTKKGFWVSAIKKNSTIIYPLEKRLVGRVLSGRVFFRLPAKADDPCPKLRVFPTRFFNKDDQLDPVRAQFLAFCFKRVLIRSALSCRLKKRLCQLCYGWTIPHGHLAPLGEAVGILAAQSIGEPGTQLTMRTFHTGGVFSSELCDEIRAPYTGIVKYEAKLKGHLLRTTQGQIGFLVKEAGCISILPTSQKPLQNLFKLDFPKQTILFFRPDYQITINELILELPKEQDDENEEVLTQYIYSAKRSGVITMSRYVFSLDAPTLLGPRFSSIKTLKLVKKGFLRMPNRNPNVSSFIISATHLHRNKSLDFLPKKGDLVNEKVIFNITELVNLESAGNINFSQFTFQKLILNLNFLQIFYNKIGYFISNVKSETFFIQTLTKNTHQRDFELRLFQKEYQTKSAGTAFFPKLIPFLFFWASEPILNLERNFFPLQRKNVNKIKKANKQKKIPSSTKIIRSKKSGELKKLVRSQNLIKSLKSTELKKLVRLDTFTKAIESIALPNQLKQQFEQITDFISPTKFLRIRKSKNITKIICGKTFEFKKLGEIPVLTKYWKKRGTEICKQFNLQGETRAFKARKDGFFVFKLTQKIKLKRLFKLKRVFKSKHLFRKKFSLQLRKIFKNGWVCFLNESSSSLGSSKHKYNMTSRNTTLENFTFWGKHSLINTIFDSENLTYESFPFYELEICAKKEAKIISKSNESAKPLKNFIKKEIGRERNKIICRNTLRDQRNDKICFLLKPTKEYSFFKVQSQSKLLKLTNETKKTDEFKKNQNLKTWSTNSYLREVFYECNREQRNSLIFNNPIRCFVNLKNFNIKSEKLKVFKCENWVSYSFIINKNSVFKRTTFEMTKNLKLGINFFINKTLKGTNVLNNLSNVIIAKKEIKINSPLIKILSSSPYTGEVLNSQENKGSFILTNKDTFYFSIPNLNFQNCHVGKYMKYGEEIFEGKAIPKSGQIISIRKNLIELRLADFVCVSRNSEFFCKNNDFLSKNSRIFSKAYRRLIIGDIVQGIPKIAEFFEARDTKHGLAFSGSVNAKLHRRFELYLTKKHGLIKACRKSVFFIQNYIINSIFKLYTSQGVTISDKHLEIIVRQMTSKVKIIRSRFPRVLPNEIYSRRAIEKFNNYYCFTRYIYYDKTGVLAPRWNTSLEESQYVLYEPIVLGITKVALTTKSIISKASFQETTRMLSRGVVRQSKDFLRGLKENIILGNLIPVGTGLRRRYYRRRPVSIYAMAYRFRLMIFRVLLTNTLYKNPENFRTNSKESLNPIRRSLIKIIFHKSNRSRKLWNFHKNFHKKKTYNYNPADTSRIEKKKL